MSWQQNTSTTSRSSSASIAGNTFNVTQSGSQPPTCTSFGISPTSASPSSSAGSTGITITGSPSGCQGGNWSAAGNGSWLSVSPTSGSGSGSATVSWQQNTSTSSRSGSASIAGNTFSVTQSGTGTSGEVLVDGGFESATATGNFAPAWNIWPASGSGHSLIRAGEPYPHAGANYAFLGGTDSTAGDIIAQTITIPSGAASVSVSFWVDIVTSETPGFGAYDYLYAGLYNLDGSWVADLKQLTNEDAATSGNVYGNYVKVGPLDLSAYKGQTLQLAFLGFTDSTLPTAYLIDDVSVTTGGSSSSARRYDHNGDAKADVLWRHATTGVNWMYLMNGNGVTSSVLANTEPDLNWEVVGVADFDGDAKSDILWRNKVTGMNFLYRMNGNNVTSLFINTEPNLSWKVAGIGDFDADGKCDVFWRNSATGQNWIYKMDGNVIAGSLPVPTEADLNWKVAAIADFDGDGKADILWRNSVTGANWMYRMNGNTIVASQPVIAVSDLNWEVVGAGDFNGDSRADVLWRHKISGTNYLHEMNGNLATAFWINTEPDLNWKVANVADYNGDGRADILWRNGATGANWMYQMDGHAIAGSLAVQSVPDTNWKVMR